MSRFLLAAGAALFAIAVILALTLPSGKKSSGVEATAVVVSMPAHTTTKKTPPKPAPPPAPSPSIPFSWSSAGAIVWHMGDVDPAWLAQQMKAAGFGWAAVYLNTPPDASWIARFRQASGLPVGGWSVLGEYPQYDAAQAAKYVKQYGLSFYIADAEEPYGYTDMGTVSDTRYARSRVFVASFRKLEPTLPAAVSSYCRPDAHDIDWNAWVKGGFDFLPQAYVNDFGMHASPRLCTNAAKKWFPKDRVHPTIASYSGLKGIVSPLVWGQLLKAAGTQGFSIYPAEAGMSAENWQAYGQSLPALAAKP